MKLTIDTKADTSEEIQKAVEFLNTLMQLKGSTNTTSAKAESAFSQLFNQTALQTTEPPSTIVSSSAQPSVPKAPVPKLEVFDVDDLFEDTK